MSEHLRIAIADDEALARRRLARLLDAMPQVRVALVANSGEELLASLPTVEVDALLLDIHMTGMSGIEVLRRLGDDAPYVVYVTGHPEHAIDAFDAGAIDYVLKPVEDTRLRRSIERVHGLLTRSATPVAASPTTARIAIESRGGIELVAPSDVSHASFDGQLVTLHLRERTLVTDKTLADLEPLLTPHGFERVHRRHLLNLHRVARLQDEESGGYTAECDDGVSVPVSRQAARLLRRRLLG